METYHESDNTLKKVLIFGTSGFIGSRIENFLSKENFSVHGYSSATCNLLDENSVTDVLEDINQDTCVIFCSAIGRAIEDSFDSMCKNIKMVQNICSYHYASGIRHIIFLSSADIYGMPPQTLPIDENTYPMANGYYALSKYVCENILKLKFKDICPITILRLPGVYGKGDNFKSIIGKFIHKALIGEDIVIFGDGEVRRDYAEVEDICRIVYDFINHPHNNVYNIATGTSYSLNNIINIIKENFDSDFKVSYSAKNDPRSSDLIYDNTKIVSAISGLTFIDMNIGIRKYISQLNRQHGKNSLF